MGGHMPDSCCKPDYDAAFGADEARRQAVAYGRSGATGSTRRLLDAITAQGTVAGASVLDVGGGVGVIGLELLAAGASTSTEVDASSAYVAVARHEADRRGLGDRASFHHADFVDIADSIAPADIVTLHRSVCCYRDWATLVDRSLDHATRLYGLVYPSDRWWTRMAISLGNVAFRLTRNAFRGYVHPERLIDARIRAAGFERRYHHRGLAWQTVVYARAASTGVATALPADA